jgi:hypothetical protein
MRQPCGFAGLALQGNYKKAGVFGPGLGLNIDGYWLLEDFASRHSSSFMMVLGTGRPPDS